MIGRDMIRVWALLPATGFLICNIASAASATHGMRVSAYVAPRCSVSVVSATPIGTTDAGLPDPRVRSECIGSVSPTILTTEFKTLPVESTATGPLSTSETSTAGTLFTFFY